MNKIKIIIYISSVLIWIFGFFIIVIKDLDRNLYMALLGFCILIIFLPNLLTKEEKRAYNK